MKLNIRLLLLAAFIMLTIPLIMTGSAGAAVTPNYNGDASVQLTTGGWALPSGVCIGANASTTDTNADSVPNAVTLPGDMTYGDCYSQTDAAVLAMSGTHLINLSQTLCTNNGYSWSSRHSNCGLNWTAVDPNGQAYSSHSCLTCHTTDYMVDNGHDAAAGKESYLLTGHKNMVRPVTPSVSANGLAAGTYTMLQPNGTPYSFPGIDWSAGTYNSTQILWVASGWYSYKSGPLHEIVQPGGSYSCGRCHATGWSSDAAQNTSKEPSVSFGNSIDNLCATGATTGVCLAGGVTDDNNVTSSWDQWGIECSRCHYANGGSHSNFPQTYDPTQTPVVVGNTGGDVTAMCATCHRQEDGAIPEGYNPNNTGNNMGPNNASNTTGDYSSKYANFDANGVKVHYGSSGSSDSHGPIYQFLNSPHGQFTGSFSDIGCPPDSIVPAAGYACDGTMSKYATDFDKDPLANNSPIITLGQNGRTDQGGGCTGCHDVHYSVNGATGQNNPDGTSKAVKQCTVCHTNPADDPASGGYAPQVGTFNHPSTDSGTPVAGTPFDPAVYGNWGSCVVCHMPGSDHYFRISTDPNYSTITRPVPTAGEFANTAADTNSGYTNAIWNDLNSTCGQCHGGGAANVATTGSITTGTYALTVADATNLAVGEAIDVAGAGTGGADLKTYINAISGTTVTLASKAGKTVTSATVIQDYTNGSTAPYFTKTELSAAAAGMHDTGNTGNCLACHGDNGDGTFTNSKAAGKLDIITGTGGDGDPAHKNHHAYVTCATCHTNPHAAGQRAQNTGESGTAPLEVYADGSAGNAFCRNCHENSGQYARHHSVDAVASIANLACTSCHSVTPGQPGLVGYASVTVPSTDDTNTNCLKCHQTNDFGTPTEVATPAVADILPIGSVNHAGTTTCTECHYKTYGTMELVSMPETSDTTFVNTVCGRCHGANSTTTTNNAPYIATADLMSYAATMHGVAAGTKLPTVVATIADTTANPVTSVSGGNGNVLSGATGDTIKLTDASVDTNTPAQTLTITVDWGDDNSNGATGPYNGAGGSAPTHVYANAGTFNIVETVTNTAGLSSTQYTQVVIAAASSTNSIGGMVYNCYSATSACTTSPTAGVKVKLWNGTKLVQQVVTADGTNGTTLGQYTFGHVDFLNSKTYTITVKDPNHQNYVYTTTTTMPIGATNSSVNFYVDGSKTSTGSVIPGSYTIIAKDGTTGGNTYPNAKITITQNAVTKFRWTSSMATTVPFRVNFNNRTGNWTVTARWKGCSVDPVDNYTQALCTAASGTWIEPTAVGTQNCTVSIDGGATYSSSVTVDPTVTIPVLDPNDPNGRPSVTVLYNNCN
jgi:hypothetical protein